MKNTLKNRLIETLKQFILENEIEIGEDTTVDENLRLIGVTSIFDSMELVQFIVEVESILEEEFNIIVELTSEKSMSRRNSPFSSINTMVEFISNESE